LKPIKLILTMWSMHSFKANFRGRLDSCCV